MMEQNIDSDWAQYYKQLAKRTSFENRKLKNALQLALMALSEAEELMIEHPVLNGHATRIVQIAKIKQKALEALE